jgi:two-component system, OmpR family, response regulator
MEQPAPHILVVDDDAEIRDLVSGFLKRNSYRVMTARDAKAARQAMADYKFDLVVLDLMMPGEDGLSLCRDLRAKSKLPVIMVTARGEETDRIVGLEIGADDYLPKPFSPRELLARIRAVLRRAGDGSVDLPDTEQVMFEGWTLDLGTRALTSPAGQSIDLTGGEFELLKAFVQRPQRVLTRDQLLDITRGRDPILFDRAIDAQVSRLRKKIELDPGNPTLIKTVRAGGYVFAAKVEPVGAG